MKKWYNEEYSFEIEVTGFLRGNHTERYCRNGEEIGDKYSCTYGCPVNAQGYGICSKVMMMLFPVTATNMMNLCSTVFSPKGSGETFKR